MDGCWCRPPRVNGVLAFHNGSRGYARSFSVGLLSVAGFLLLFFLDFRSIAKASSVRDRVCVWVQQLLFSLILVRGLLLVLVDWKY
jgi:hypothetical protein